MASTMSPDEIRNLLEELAVRLDTAGIAAGIRVVGGAAISILAMIADRLQTLTPLSCPLGLQQKLLPRSGQNADYLPNG